MIQDFYKICDIQLYPYGFTKRQFNGTSWSFTCQHGPRECQGNIIETCAIKLNHVKTNVFQFIICLEENLTDWSSQGEKCATKFEMNWDIINTCSYSQIGINYEVEMAEAT